MVFISAAALCIVGLFFAGAAACFLLYKNQGTLWHERAGAFALGAVLFLSLFYLFIIELQREREKETQSNISELPSGGNLSESGSDASVVPSGYMQTTYKGHEVIVPIADQKKTQEIYNAMDEQIRKGEI